MNPTKNGTFPLAMSKVRPCLAQANHDLRFQSVERRDVRGSDDGILLINGGAAEKFERHGSREWIRKWAGF